MVLHVLLGVQVVYMQKGIPYLFFLSFSDLLKDDSTGAFYVK